MTHDTDERPARGTSSRPGHLRSVTHLVRLVLALLLAVAGATLATPAGADDVPQYLRIDFTSVTPSVIGPTGVLRIEGKVTNTSDVAITNAWVHLWRSVEPITDADDLATILASPANVPLGRRLLGTENGNLYRLTPDDDPTLEPGESRTFSVQATASAPKGSAGLDEALEFPTLDAVYPVGIHVRGIPDGGSNQTLARGRLLVPYLKDGTTLTHTSVVMLTARPSRLPDQTFADDTLATQLAAGGRLRVLLDAARRPGASFVVDPALLDAVQVMTSPYEVHEGNDLVAGAGTEAAVVWLADVRPLLSAGVGYRLPYGNPDLRAAAEVEDASALARAAAVLPSSNLASALPLAVVPRDGILGETLATALSAVGPAVVLATNTSPASGVLAVASQVVVGVDASATAGGPGPEPSTSRPQVIGRMLAAFALGDPATGPVVTLIDDEASAALDGVAVPGLVRVPLPDLLTRTTPASGALVAVVEAGVDPDWMDSVRRSTTTIGDWSDLTGRTTLASERATEVLNQGLSIDWGTDAQAASDWLDLSLADMGSVLGSQGVTLSISKSFVMSEATQQMPLTITNDLDVPVTVTVGFVAENPQRLSIPDTEPVLVTAGESVTVMFQPNAQTNGAVAVDAQLRTVGGRPIGPVRSFTVTATSLGRVGWIIMMASGIVFLGATSVRIKQVQRERARVSAVASGGQTGPTVDEGTS